MKPLLSCIFCLQTTLLNQILTAHHGKRIAVIENEACLHSQFFLSVVVDSHSYQFTV
jgi:hypothetical protein